MQWRLKGRSALESPADCSGALHLFWTDVGKRFCRCYYQDAPKGGNNNMVFRPARVVSTATRAARLCWCLSRQIQFHLNLFFFIRFNFSVFFLSIAKQILRSAVGWATNDRMRYNIRLYFFQCIISTIYFVCVHVCVHMYVCVSWSGNIIVVVFWGIFFDAAKTQTDPFALWQLPHGAAWRRPRPPLANLYIPDSVSGTGFTQH